MNASLAAPRLALATSRTSLACSCSCGPVLAPSGGAGWNSRRQAPPLSRSQGPVRRQLVTLMGNKGTGGPFAPLVVVTRNVVGEKKFNNFRGKAISLHSQIIKDFCKQLGADNKQVQGVIRLAKKNGEKLGFLA